MVKGTARVRIGEKEHYLHENESIYVPKSTVHRLENPGKVPLEMMEVQVGEYVGEDDIVGSKMSTDESKSNLLRRLDWLDGWIFVYFLTLSAELLNVQVYLYKLKIGHVLAAGLFFVFFSLYRKIYIDRSVRAPAIALFFSLLLSALFSSHIFRCAGYLGVYIFNLIAYFILPYNLFVFRGSKILTIYFASFILMGIYASAQVAFSLIRDL